MTFKRKHGYATTGSGRPRSYKSWTSMNLRCNSPTSQDFNRYGARGIKICERWKDFANFVADMGEPPKGHSLDRIDNSGNYEPSNCRWATPLQQARNRRNNIWIEFDGVRRTLGDWALLVGISVTALSRRFKSGWPIGLALTTPKVHRWWRGNGVDRKAYLESMKRRSQSMEST